MQKALTLTNAQERKFSVCCVYEKQAAGRELSEWPEITTLGRLRLKRLEYDKTVIPTPEVGQTVAHNYV